MATWWPFAMYHPLWAKLSKDFQKIIITLGSPKTWCPLRLIACRQMQGGGEGSHCLMQSWPLMELGLGDPTIRAYGSPSPTLNPGESQYLSFLPCRLVVHGLLGLPLLNLTSLASTCLSPPLPLLPFPRYCPLCLPGSHTWNSLPKVHPPSQSSSEVLKVAPLVHHCYSSSSPLCRCFGHACYYVGPPHARCSYSLFSPDLCL